MTGTLHDFEDIETLNSEQGFPPLFYNGENDNDDSLKKQKVENQEDLRKSKTSSLKNDPQSFFDLENKELFASLNKKFKDE